MLSDHTQPSQPQSQHFLPNLHTLHVPLVICCDIIRQASNPSNLYELYAEVSQLHPHDPLFLQLVKTLQDFQKLDHLGLRLVPSLHTIPQAIPGDYNWDGHPPCELRQVHHLSFHQSQGLLSLGDIVCLHLLSFIFLALLTGQDMMHAYMRLFPMLEVLYVAEKGQRTGWGSLNLCANQIPPSELSQSFQALS